MPQLFIVTGKGGTGKTTIAAAMAQRAAAEGRRVLLVELAADRSIGLLFGRRHLNAEPTPLAPRLTGVRVEPRALLEAYFNRLLRLPFLTRRLFASVTFNAVTTAAPGVSEFLILDNLLQWVDSRTFTRRRSYDLVILDGPATGHAHRLLRTPRQLATMVPGGPIGSSARRLLALLADHERTQIVLVAIPDEMAINETLEAHAMLTDDLAMHVARPVLNRIVPRRFNASEAEAVRALSAAHPHDPVLRAARLSIAGRQNVERHQARLRRGFGITPIGIRQITADAPARSDLEHIGAVLWRGLSSERAHGQE